MEKKQCYRCSNFKFQSDDGYGFCSVDLSVISKGVICYNDGFIPNTKITSKEEEINNNIYDFWQWFRKQDLTIIRALDFGNVYSSYKQEKK